MQVLKMNLLFNTHHQQVLTLAFFITWGFVSLAKLGGMKSDEIKWYKRLDLFLFIALIIFLIT